MYLFKCIHFRAWELQMIMFCQARLSLVPYAHLVRVSGPLGCAWIRHYCTFEKGSNIFSMCNTEAKPTAKQVQRCSCFSHLWDQRYCLHQILTGSVSLLSQNGVMSNPTEKYKLKSCIRRKTDSIDKRFCFDIEVVERWVSALTTQYRCFKYLTLPEKYRKTYRPLLFTLVLLWTCVTVCLPWSTKGEILKNVQALFFPCIVFYIRLYTVLLESLWTL